MCKLSVSGTTCAPPARRKGVTPGKSPGHNDEGIDEQGTESGSIPDARIVLYLVMGREKVRSIRTPAVLSSLWRVQAYCIAGRGKDPEIDWATAAGCQYQNRAAGSKQISDLVSQPHHVASVVTRSTCNESCVKFWRCQFPFVSGTALFTQDTRASPGDGLITQSTRAAVNRRCSSVLCMEKPSAVAAALTKR